MGLDLAEGAGINTSIAFTVRAEDTESDLQRMIGIRGLSIRPAGCRPA